MKRAVALVLVLIAGACSSPEPASAITLDLTEFHIEPSTSSFVPGDVTLTATNRGEFTHTIVVTDGSGAVVAASDLIEPGGSMTVTVALSAPGYEVSCRIVSSGADGALFDHYEQGMLTTLSRG